MISVYLYSLFFANNPVLNLIVDPAIEALAKYPLVSSFAHDGVSLLEHFHSRGLHGCSLFFPAVIIFLIFIFKQKNVKNKNLFRLTGIWFLLCGIVIAVAAGGIPSERHVHALPLVTAFLFFYTLLHMKNKRNVYIWLALILIFGFYQSQNSSLLNVSDQQRYYKDLELAEMIDDEIRNKIGYSFDDRELVIFGEYKFKYTKNYLRGEVIGRSAMLWGGSIKPDRPAMFMNNHGYNYIPLKSGTDMNAIKEHAKLMPAFPNDGWVSKYSDEIIIVKLSEIKN